MPNNYECYLAGWQDCLDGADGRFPDMYRPEYNKAQRRYWFEGWQECFEREDEDDEPLPEEWLSLDD